MSKRRTPLAVATAAALATTLAVMVAPAATADTGIRTDRAKRVLQSAAVVNSVIGDTNPRGTVFGPSSVWKADVRSAPLSSNSAALVGNLSKQVADYYGGVAAFNVSKYNTSVYTVDADQARIDVKWNNCQKKTYTPKGLLGEGGQFTQVPIPADAVPAAGNDGQLTIFSPASDQLWEFWKAKKVDGVWQACWGGRIDSVSTSPGYFTDGFGASASGLAVSAGAVGIQDAQSGSIDHALSLAVINAAHWSTFSYPAQRSDGNQPVSAANTIQEGQRFRLDPSVNVDALNLTPIAKMIARSAQKYGFIVTDRSGAVAVSAESPSAVIADTGVNPWTPLMAGKPSYLIMKNFPWDKLQALPVDYGKPAPVVTPTAKRK